MLLGPSRHPPEIFLTRESGASQDLQKLIAAADSGTEGARRAERKSVKKKLAASHLKKGVDQAQDTKVTLVPYVAEEQAS